MSPRSHGTEDIDHIETNKKPEDLNLQKLQTKYKRTVHDASLSVA